MAKFRFFFLFLGCLGNIYFSQASSLPKTVILKRSVSLTIFHQGKTVGQMTLPSEREVNVLSQSNEWLLIESGLAQGLVLIQDTDYEKQIVQPPSKSLTPNLAKGNISSLPSSRNIPWKINRSLTLSEIQSLTQALYQENKGIEILQEGVIALWTNATMTSASSTWVEHLRLAQALKLWTEATNAASLLDSETATALFSNKPLMENLGATLSPLDRPDAIWKILSDLQKTFPDQMEKYPALAIALAVVHDEAFPAHWPDSQAGTIPRKDNNWIELFRYFTEQDQKNRLLLKLTILEADQLKFVVDAPIDLSEFAWANQNIKFSRREFDQCYFFVSYDQPRLVQQVYQWPWPENYTLANIAKRNGICVDQAYFSFLSGKAKGLPTLIFSGAGKSGYHAWFGYMKADDQWNMDTGRYQTDSYTVGQSIDPQTRLPINDHQLQIISHRTTSTPLYQQSKNLLRLTQLASDLDPTLLETQKTNLPTIPFFASKITAADYKALLQKALKICPANAEVWFQLSEWLANHGTFEELRLHYTAMSEQFKNQKDLGTWAQERLSQIVHTSGNRVAAEALQKKIMIENRRDRTDLGIAVAAQLLQEKIKREEFESALTEFCRIVKSYKKEGGGTLFFDLVDPFIRETQKTGQDQIAKKALQFAQNTMDYDPNPTSQVQQGFEALNALLNLKKKGR